MKPPHDGEARTILVVEDEQAIRDLLRLHLDLAHFDVREAADGRRGLDLARAERFDVIILDVMLPGLDGVTLCRALRLEGASRDAPILMLLRETLNRTRSSDWKVEPTTTLQSRSAFGNSSRAWRRSSAVIERTGAAALPPQRIAAGALQVESTNARRWCVACPSI